MITCQDCGRDYTPNRSQGHRGKRCNSCIQIARRVRRREQIRATYEKYNCKICGYEGPDRAMTFHHVDPATKLFTVSGSECRAWESVKKELEKCILLCIRCHAEVHSGMHPEYIED